MEVHLAPLLRAGAAALNAEGWDWSLSYGTLLGAVRDGKIMPYEFDVDVEVDEEHCSQMGALRATFEAQGLHMYERGEYIPQKAKWGYSPYLHVPCARAYDANYKYYLDIYWRRTVRAADVERERVNPPRSWDGKEDLVCGFEGYREVEGADPMDGGCLTASSYRPLRKMTFLGMEMGVPADPETVLADAYGETWRTPTGKGYKYVVCSPAGGVSATLVVLLLLAFLASTGYMLRKAIALRRVSAVRLP